MMEPLTEGTAHIVQAGLDEGRQTLFDCGGPSAPTGPPMAEIVPLARTDELLLAVSGPAVKAVLEKRIEQMVKFGHTVEGDLDLPLGWLPNDARIRLQSACDAINSGERNLQLARRRVVTAAALCLAAIDVIDATINAEG